MFGNIVRIDTLGARMFIILRTIFVSDVTLENLAIFPAWNIYLLVSNLIVR